MNSSNKTSDSQVNAIRCEVADNLHRLFQLRDLFEEAFVGRQAIVCLKMLGGLGAAW